MLSQSVKKLEQGSRLTVAWLVWKRCLITLGEATYRELQKKKTRGGDSVKMSHRKAKNNRIKNKMCELYKSRSAEAKLSYKFYIIKQLLHEVIRK